LDAARLILTAIVLWLLAGCCTGISVAQGQLVKRAIDLPISVSQLQAIEQVCIVKLSCRRVGKIIDGSILPYFRSISALMLDFNAMRAPNNTDAETNLSDRVKKMQFRFSQDSATANNKIFEFNKTCAQNRFLRKIFALWERY
jgi:hypothetical protein